jgi:hypothetical protein
MKCGFNEAYIGFCRNDAPCRLHKDEKCMNCKDRAIKECSLPVNGMVLCDYLLCSNEECQKRHEAFYHQKKKKRHNYK